MLGSRVQSGTAVEVVSIEFSIELLNLAKSRPASDPTIVVTASLILTGGMIIG
jgi:hypothetical protein